MAFALRPWTMREGLVTEAKIANGIVIGINPPLPLESLMGHAGAAPPEPSPAPAPLLPAQPSAATGLPQAATATTIPGTLEAPPMPEEPGPPIPPTLPVGLRNHELVPLDKVDFAKQKYVSPKLPGFDKWKKPTMSRRYIPVAAVERLFKIGVRCQGELTIKTVEQEQNPPWKPGMGEVYVILRVWETRGICERRGRGQYHITMPKEEHILEVVKALEVQSKTGVSPWRLANEFWVPETIATGWLNLLAKAGHLREALGEEYVSRTPDLAASLAEVVVEAGSNGQQTLAPKPRLMVKGVKLPDLDKWRQFTGEFYKCILCGKGTKIGWKHGQLKMCDPCHTDPKR